MFIHSHRRISELFNRHLNRLKELGPVNIWGSSGLGKLFYIKEYIRHIECGGYTPFLSISEPYKEECSCGVCSQIVENKAADIMFIEKSESIRDLRDLVNSFINSLPIEFRFKYLIVQNLDMFNNNELDVFLNVFEEPPKHLKIFVTSVFIDKISNPIQSRLSSFCVNSFNRETFETIVKNTTELKQYLKVLNRYNFNTINQLLCYNKFEFEERFKEFFVNVESSYDIEVGIEQFLKVVGEQTVFLELEVIDFFFEFYIDRLNEFLDLNKDNPNIGVFKQFSDEKLMPLYSDSLFKCISLKNPYYMNIKNQMFLLLNTVYMSRKIARL